MLKVTQKCQPLNRGTEQSLLLHLVASRCRSSYGSPVPTRRLVFCRGSEVETGLFFLLSLMHASIGMPVWMQRSGANLLAAVAAGEEALSEATFPERYGRHKTQRKHSDGASRRSSLSPRTGAVADGLSRLQNQRRATFSGAGAQR